MTSDHAHRLVDVLVAGAVLWATLPILAVASIAIKLDDGGPLIHRRRVAGKGGHEFDALKLRTMRPDAEEWLRSQPDLLDDFRRFHKLQNDPRITRVGRVLRMLSVDELPQLINVLRGEMSMVGPRIVTAAEVPLFGEAGAVRQSVRPGLTGLWQVSNRGERNFQIRAQLDAEYVRRRSVTYDLTIMAKTIPAVVRRRGAV
jgi:lipopolysaccharide/colanic/teichoic acid biosynthesis glycosyltransferase